MSSLFPGSKSLDTYLVLSSVRSKQTFDPRITHQANYGKRRPVLGLNRAHLMACKYTLLSRPCHYSYRFVLTRTACRNILSILHESHTKIRSPPRGVPKKKAPSKKLTCCSCIVSEESPQNASSSDSKPAQDNKLSACSSQHARLIYAL